MAASFPEGCGARRGYPIRARCQGALRDSLRLSVAAHPQGALLDRQAAAAQALAQDTAHDPDARELRVQLRELAPRERFPARGWRGAGGKALEQLADLA